MAEQEIVQAVEETAAEPKKRPFAKGLNYYKLFWVFFIACILGVIIETIWCLITLQRFESRSGLIYGPFNPVYGFGALIMTLALYRLDKRRDLWIFLGSAVIGGIFEYLCSWFQEMAFGTVSWEYSGTQLNFHGRTNVMFMFFWGILGLLWVKDLYPRMSKLIEKIPFKVGVPLTWALTVFMVLNMAISAMAVYRQSERRENIPADNVVRQFLDEHYDDEFLSIIYPNMMAVEESDNQ